MPELGASLHFGFENWLARIQKMAPIRNVIDFGCGGGYVGSRLLEAFPGIKNLVGVDIWGPPCEFHFKNKQPYTRIFQADMVHMILRNQLPVIDEPWDLWVFGDALEHIPLQHAREIVKAAPCPVAARLPIGRWPEGELDGNKAEEHLWSFYPDQHIFTFGKQLLYFQASCEDKIADFYKWPQNVSQIDYPEFHCLIDQFEPPTGAYIGNVIWGIEEV
jgi:hypothetical protein